MNQSYKSWGILCHVPIAETTLPPRLGRNAGASVVIFNHHRLINRGSRSGRNVRARLGWFVAVALTNRIPLCPADQRVLKFSQCQ